MKNFLLISRQEAEELSIKNGISLTQAKKILESTAIRISLPKDVQPIFDDEGFFLGTRTKVKIIKEHKTNDEYWEKYRSQSLKELFGFKDDD